MKQLIFKFMMKLAMWSINYLYNYVDKNKDGKLSQNEIFTFVSDIRKLLSKIKNKNF